MPDDLDRQRVCSGFTRPIGKNGRVSTRRVDWKLLLASLGIAAGLVLVVMGVRSSITGREQQGLPAEIESVDPVRDATQVLQQTAVVADLIPGYTGVFTIDGITIDTYDPDSLDPANTMLPKPGQQIVLPPVTIYDRGNATLRFEPTDKSPITTLATGPHEVKLTYWDLKSPKSKNVYIWTFYIV